ncbi:MAG: LLM class flavin-dependent oxidoreductase [Pseudomonadales bacterium]
MKLDIFTEVQKRDCDHNGGFPQLLDETLKQAKAADKAGFRCWWQVEHHCTEDFSYSSCPEMLLEAIALNTKRLRVGHAGILAPFAINHPLRAAERAALLDNLSNGRIEVGLAKSGGKEWETFNVSEESAAADLVELTRLLPLAWSDRPLCWNSDRWQVANRNVLPKPVQQPHPPLWHTVSSPPSFERAGSMGVGVLATTLFAPLDALHSMVTGYRRAIAGYEPPPGGTVNNQAGVFTFVHVAKSTKAAIASGAPRSALWYVSSAPRVFNVPRQIFYQAIRGQTDPRSAPSTAALKAPEAPDPNDTSDSNPVVSLMKREFAGEEISNEEIFETIRHLDSVVIGDLATCRAKMRKFQEIGMDRLMCLVQMGEIPHARVMNCIRLIGAELIPEFDPS